MKALKDDTNKSGRGRNNKDVLLDVVKRVAVFNKSLKEPGIMATILGKKSTAQQRRPSGLLNEIMIERKKFDSVKAGYDANLNKRTGRQRLGLGR